MPPRKLSPSEIVSWKIIWERTKDPARPYEKMLLGHSYSVRVNDAASTHPFTLLIRGDLLADLDSWPRAWVRPDAPGSTERRTLALARDVAFHAVNDRPVKVVEFPDGSDEVLVYHFRSGGFVADSSYWEHVYRVNPFKDVDTFNEEQFNELLRGVRAETVAKQLSSPVAWTPTGDAEVPYQSIMDGHLLTMRLNDFPDEPLFTLMVDGEELVALEDWPPAWSGGP